MRSPHLPILAGLIATVCLLGSTDCLAQSLRDWRGLAAKMVDEEIASAGVTNERVLRALRETPRHEFVPPNERRLAYYDMALPIGNEQTISPPFVVAYMTQEVDPQPTDRVLEIGTGSGYQAAVLSPLVRDVYTIEIVEPLGKRAARTLKKLGYKNVFARVGDGYQGWPEAAPFDKIIVTCSPEKVPQPLIDQLRDGGLMIVPVGERYQQNLYLFRKHGDRLESEALKATLFVPMTGEAEAKREVLPDPLRPTIANGSFEETLEDANQKDAEPAGWHYQRQLALENDPASAPNGRRFVTFQNKEPGLAAHALQGFAVDGRKVSKLRLDSVIVLDVDPQASQIRIVGPVFLFQPYQQVEPALAFKYLRHHFALKGRLQDSGHIGPRESVKRQIVRAQPDM